jgi:ligand-binding sensor domain-containing protein
MKRLLIILLIYPAAFTVSQTPPSYHYTPKEGLPSSNVMDMIQDSDGFIWFATANGISRFDGLDFKNYGIADGLNSNMITSLLEGNDGGIYIGNYENGINIFKDSKIKKYSGTVEKELYINHLFFDQNKLYGYGNEEIYSFAGGEGRAITDTVLFNGENQIYLNKLEKLSDKTIIALIYNGFYRFENDKFSKLKIDGFKDTVVYCLTEDHKNNLIYAGGKGKIYIIKNYNITGEIKIDLQKEDDVFRILIDHYGNLWFSIINHGFYIIPAGSKRIFDIGRKLNLQNTQINNFFEDNEGNIWVCTFGKGVYCLNNLYITNYSEEDGLSNNNVQSIISDSHGRILIGTFNGLNIFENDSFNIIKSNSKNKLTDYIYQLNCINNKVFVCGNFENRNIIIRRIEDVEYIFFTASSFCLTKDNCYFTGGWRNEINKKKDFKEGALIETDPVIVIGEGSRNNRVTEILEDSKGNLWVGSAFGLCRITGSEKKLFTDNEVLGSKIESIIQDRTNNLWFAGDKGIACYSSENDSIKTYTKLKGYELSSSTSLAADNKNRIWAGSMNGIYIFDNISIEHMDMSLGLLSDEVLSLFYDSLKNYMWIGTSSGLSRLDLDQFNSYFLPPLTIRLTNFSVNDSAYSFELMPVLDYKHNNIQIDFTAVNFSSPNSVTYSYKLNENKWQDIKVNNINFPELEPDNYELSIKAKRMNGIWSEPYALHFKITPPFYRILWVEAGGAVLFSLFVVIAARKTIKYNKKKDREKLELANRMNELKHQAVAAMMNPHFIFNSLSSVQYLVNMNKQKEANDYISLMARLVRMNLDIASKAFITLEEELKRLKLYLSIEKLRLENEFNYTVNIDKEIRAASVTIPNMIIQPFVENSIWHGIAPLKTTGIIKVNINYEDIILKEEKYKFLIIRIIDNGVGYSASRQNKKEGHTSRAIKIIEERLTIISRKMNLPVPIVINDLGKRAEGSSGTEVILSLPPELYRINN